MACQRRDQSHIFFSSEAPQDSSWLLVYTNDSLRTLVDTSTLQRRGDYVRVWIRLVDVRAERRAEQAPPFYTFETLQDIRCTKQIAQGVAIRTPNEAGVPFTSPVINPRWQPFEEHGLTGSILRPVCAALSQLKKGRLLDQSGA